MAFRHSIRGFSVAAFIACVFPSCNDTSEDVTSVSGVGREKDPEEVRLEAELKELHEKIEFLKDEKEKLTDQHDSLKDAARRFSMNQKQVVALEKELPALEVYAAQLKQTLEKSESQLNEWRAASRKSFVGMKLGDLSGSDGTVYPEAIVKSVTGETVTVESGSKEIAIPFEELSDDLKEKLVFESATTESATAN